MEHLSNDQKDHPNQHEKCGEMGHLVVNMMKSQWKLRQQHQNFPTIWDPSRKVNYMSKVVSDFTGSINSTRLGKPVLRHMLSLQRQIH